MNYQFDLSEGEFRLMRDFIHEKYGIYLKDERIPLMKMKLYPLVTNLGLDSYKDYFNFLKCGKSGEKELARMISLLTNNETYFFRETPQLEALKDHILPQLREEKISLNKKNIKIISAGCSTGEEVYTIAMLLFETGCFFWGWDVQVIGIDISAEALKRAAEGVYYPQSFRMMEPVYKKRFFTKNSKEYYHVKDNIKI